MNNPIRYVDPDGRKVDDIIIPYKGQDYEYKNGKLFLNGSEFTGKQKGLLKKTTNALNKISTSNEGKAMLNELSSSTNRFEVLDARKRPGAKKGSSGFVASDNSKAYANQYNTDPALTNSRNHQAQNGETFLGGSGGTIYWNSSGALLPTTSSSGGSTAAVSDLAHEMFHGLDANRGLLDDRMHLGIKRLEWQAVFRENTLRSELGLPIRTHYITSEDPSGNFLGGSGASMLSNGKPILPSWYKK